MTSGSGSTLWPHSPALWLGPWWARPSTAMPAPAPVPRITPKTTRWFSARAVGGLGDGEAVGVVRGAHVTAQDATEVVLDGPAVQPRRAGPLGNPRPRVERAGQPDPHRAGAANRLLDLSHHRCDQVQAAVVVRPRRRRPRPGQLRAVLGERDHLDLGPAPVDPDQHPTSLPHTRADAERPPRNGFSMLARPYEVDGELSASWSYPAGGSYRRSSPSSGAWNVWNQPSRSERLIGGSSMPRA